jgi:Mg-chelatase subunit ChlD
MLRFTEPLAPLLLLTLPLVFVLGWPSRGYGRRREIASLTLRVMMLICLIFALAGVEIKQSGKNSSMAVVFLVDVSDSMSPSMQQVALNYINQAMAAMRPEDQAAIIAFGGDALVEHPMAPSLSPSGTSIRSLNSTPVTTQTDLAEAIQLALALFPPESAHRMVILSDGATTSGDAQNAARLAQAAGVELVVVPIIAQSTNEVLVSEVTAPTQLRQGDQFNLDVAIESSQAVQAQVSVLAGGALVFEASVSLKQGTQTLSLPLTAGQPGFLSYQVQVSPLSDDTYYQNNTSYSFSQVSGPPRILMVAPPSGESLGFRGETRPDEFSSLKLALETAGTIVELVEPYALPAELPALVEYASIILVDVPARQLTAGQMDALQSYVRDLSGGLVIVGGPTSYGVGGYFRTPLEKILPVDMQIKDEQRRPTLTMIFIIDHSGSMSELSGGATKLDLAKEAAIRSVELLQPSDRVGVIAFDDMATWVVPITELSDPSEIQAAIGTIRIGGGTDILAGLQAMAAEIPNDDSLSKHVILLTDGGANPAGIPELVAKMNEEYGVTLTTVGVGRDAAPFLPELAELGGGRYHFAADPSSIPSIFTEETSLATRAYIIEETFIPSLTSVSPILENIQAIPPLFGYVGTSAKDNAQTILVSPKGDPILAAWRYGLGKSVAFTSDATGRWASSWVAWNSFPTFWAQVVGYTISDRLLSGLQVSVEMKGEQARLLLDAADLEGGGFLNGYMIQANIVFPDGDTETVSLHQIAPGRYETTFTPTEEGAYLIRLAGEAPQPGAAGISETVGWVLSYSPEYRQLQADPDALVRVALAADGKIASVDPAEAFTHTLSAPRSSRPIWPWLLLTAILLLPVDIAVRRLVITQRDWQMMINQIKATFLRSPSNLPFSRDQRMEELLNAKQRASRREVSVEINKTGKPGSSEATRPVIVSPRIGEEQPVPLQKLQAAGEIKYQPTDSPTSETTAATLLKKKRQRRSHED